MLKIIRLIYLTFFTAILLSACSGETPTPATPLLDKIVGKWEGIGQQNDGRTWTISVEFLANPIVNQPGALINYPSLGCSGTWILKSTSVSVVTYDEQITSGQSNCIVSGQVRITYNNDNTLGYLYTSGNIDTNTATSTLSPSSANPANPPNPTPGGDTLNVTGNLTSYTGGAARAELYYFHIPIDRNNLAGTGTVSTTGAFSFTLTKPIDAVLVSSEEIYKDATLSDSSVRLATSGLVSNLFSSPDDTYFSFMASWSDKAALIANLKTILNLPNIRRLPGTYYASYYVYADRPVNITGTVQAEDGITVPDLPVPYPQELDLNLKQGWNIVYRRFVAGNNPKGILTSALDTTNPSGFPSTNWFFVSLQEVFGVSLSEDGLATDVVIGRVSALQ